MGLTNSNLSPDSQQQVARPELKAKHFQELVSWLVSRGSSQHAPQSEVETSWTAMEMRTQGNEGREGDMGDKHNAYTCRKRPSVAPHCVTSVTMHSTAVHSMYIQLCIFLAVNRQQGRKGCQEKYDHKLFYLRNPTLRKLHENRVSNIYRLLIVALFGWNRKWSQFKHTEKMKVRQRKFI